MELVVVFQLHLLLQVVCLQVVNNIFQVVVEVVQMEVDLMQHLMV